MLQYTWSKIRKDYYHTSGCRIGRIGRIGRMVLWFSEIMLL